MAGRPALNTAAARATEKARSALSFHKHESAVFQPQQGCPARRRPELTRQQKTEREGFEPSVQLPAHRISSAAPSATRTPLQNSMIPLAT